MEETFLKMVEANQNIIHKVCHIYRDKPEDHEDLFQEIVYQLWKSFPKFRGEAKVSTWMYRIALNTALADFRKNKPSVNYQDQIPEKYHPSEADEISENEMRMYEALRKLNHAERAIISLYLEDCTYEEIADIIGISENYVGVRINRIKKKLKKIII